MDDDVDVGERLGTLEAQYINVNKDVCDMVISDKKDHDQIVKNTALLEGLEESQKLLVAQVATLQVTVEGLKVSIGNALNITSRIEALETKEATEESETRSFVQRNINSILVVGMLSAIITVLGYVALVVR
jgi:hypothetical protein